MHELLLVQDLAIVMAASALATVLCRFLRLPLVLGYIIAGIAVGPNTPPFALIHDIKVIETLASLGIIFLMFSIGLEFNLKKLKVLGITALIATVFEVLLMIWIGFSIGKLLGWKFMDCLFLGAILCISSTTIIAAALIELKLLRERFAQIVVAILIVEDIVAILIIAILSAVSVSGTVSMAEVSYSFVKIVLFMILSIIIGILTVPRIIHFISKFEVSQVLIVTILGFCFGFSILGVHLGFSLALGAFLMGAVIAESKEIHTIVQKIEPLRDMFSAIFFVSVGMLIQPAVILENWFPVLIITSVMIIGKYLSVSFGVFISGNDARTSFKVALSMVQIGEFSFIIAQLGQANRVTMDSLFSITVAVSFISSFITPILIKNSNPLADWLSKYVPKPIATFGEFYDAWIVKIRERGKGESTSQVWARVRMNIIPVIIYLVLIFGLFMVAFHLQQMGRDVYLEKWISPEYVPFVYWFLTGIVIFPFWAGLLYSFDKLLWNIFFGASHKSHESEDIQESLPGRLIRNMFRMGTMIGMSLIVLTVSFPFLPNIPLLLLVGAALSLMTLWFWSLISRFHSNLDDTMRLVFEKEEPGIKKIEQEKTREELEELIKKEYPWEVMTEDVLTPFKQTAINQPIRDLKLPQVTGATIMAIYREDGTIVNPPSSTIIMPGDVLVVMGEQEQIQNAIRYLSELMAKPAALLAQDKPVAVRVGIDNESPAIGKTLADTGLRPKTGVSVIGIQRADGTTMTNPSPTTEILSGDTVILFGTEEQISKAQQILLG